MEDDLICALIFVEFFCNAFAINDSLFLAFRDNELDDSIEPCQRKNRYTCKLILYFWYYDKVIRFSGKHKVLLVLFP